MSRYSPSGTASGGWTWIFDLDDTLHHATPHIFPRMNRAMTDYVVRHLDVDEARANELRIHYWRRYGASLLGLMRHHDVDPHHFLWHTHQFPDLARIVVADPALRAALLRLPGRKVVFSNAPEHYVRSVLKILRVGDLFGGVFALEHTRFQPKPDPRGFRRLMHMHRLPPRRCIMVEDNLDNLLTAKSLGMRTVLVGAATRRPPGVDFVVRDIGSIARALGGLWRAA